MKQAICGTFLLVIGGFIFCGISPVYVIAESNCLPLNNGGVNGQQYCINPTPTPSTNTTSGFPQNSAKENKGGQQIFPSSKAKSTPRTGPEQWTLAGLFIAGGLGLFLRNKAKT